MPSNGVWYYTTGEYIPTHTLQHEIDRDIDVHVDKDICTCRYMNAYTTRVSIEYRSIIYTVSENLAMFVQMVRDCSCEGQQNEASASGSTVTTKSSPTSGHS